MFRLSTCATMAIGDKVIGRPIMEVSGVTQATRNNYTIITTLFLYRLNGLMQDTSISTPGNKEVIKTVN